MRRLVRSGDGSGFWFCVSGDSVVRRYRDGRVLRRDLDLTILGRHACSFRLCGVVESRGRWSTWTDPEDCRP